VTRLRRPRPVRPEIATFEPNRAVRGTIRAFTGRAAVAGAGSAGEPVALSGVSDGSVSVPGVPGRLSSARPGSAEAGGGVAAPAVDAGARQNAQTAQSISAPDFVVQFRNFTWGLLLTA
jgi:hypothetical protein